MTVGAKPQLNDIKHWGITGNCGERYRIVGRRQFEIRIFHRHGMNLIQWNGCSAQQPLSQLGQIACRIIVGRNALIHLKDMQCVPCKVPCGK